LEERLAGDRALSHESRQTIEKDATGFAQHGWIEEHVNIFLDKVLESPDKLHQHKIGKLLEQARKSK